MKKYIVLALVMLLSATILWSQTPNEFSYQAVARTSAGLIMEDQNITVEISIMESGSAVYTEEHAITTNQFGLFTLNIGGGSATLGDFTTIDWANGSYGVQVAMDENAGTTFVVMGTSPLLTVPFAMHAKTAENTFSGNYSDLSGVPDLSNYDEDASDDFSGDYIDLTNKPTLGGDVSGNIDFNTVERIQGRNISSNEPANGQILKWDDGLFQWIPSDDALGAAGSTDGVVSSMGITGSATKTITLSRTEGLGVLTANFTDQNTQLNESEVDSYVSNNGYLTSFSEVDGSTTNEIQDLTLTGTTLSIENGNSVNLTSLQDGYEANTDTQLSEAEVDSYVSNNGYLTSEADGDSNNEIQDLTFTGTTLSIENGNSVNLTSLQDGYEANTDTQLSEAEVDSYVSNNGYLTSEADGDSNNEIQYLNVSGSTLFITGGNNVNLSGIDTDTQLSEAEVDSYVSDNGYLTSFTETDGSTTNELQDLTLSGTTLSIENGNSVDLSSIGGSSNLSGVLTEGNDGGALQIKNIADPTADQDAATKAYVDALEARLDALIAALDLTVQQRLDLGETPKQIYDSNNDFLDSLYGKKYAGGLIFYVNSTTGTGKVITENNVSDAAEWGCWQWAVTTATNQYDGTVNTTEIVDFCGTAGIAAELCHNLVLNGYDDWYLPANLEADWYIAGNLYDNGLGGIDGYYWTSKENDAFNASRLLCFGGSHNSTNADKRNGYQVRAVRQFAQ